ncbi:NADH:flavin oxidoreductase [Kordiimonas sediminis]|uniref:NADH:flavin oxidoreductase n=1 Tax=Kordiimonas sediminis TaxID=1735581 RepID=A0A919AV29_9PROT|nr:NADH:flavin oxidoreductase [Kordiimonas sediminis]GHF26300.1 NADH:flavin oxidoreductase [Kordiimonas sediminis]
MTHIALKDYTLNNQILRNRAVVAPMSRVSTAGDGIPTKAMADYYSSFAAGGFAAVITEGTYTDRYYAQAYPNQPGITTSQQQDGWRKVVQAVKSKGAKIILQLMHAGALSQHLSSTRGPSKIEPMRTMLPGYSRKQGRYPIPEAMNSAEIDQVIDGFLKSALMAEEAGFDGVEIHSANGYLLDQFITDYTNMREDQYGGSLENRVRLTCEITQKIRSAVSPDFIVGVRLSQGKVNDFDYLWSGGLEDGKVFFSAIEEAGAHYIHFASEGKGFDHGCLTRTGESLPRQAKELTKLSVIANGGLHIPSEADRVLTGGHTDLIALGTGALANPDWPEKIEKNLPVNPFDPAVFDNGVHI